MKARTYSNSEMLLKYNYQFKLKTIIQPCYASHQIRFHNLKVTNLDVKHEKNISLCIMTSLCVIAIIYYTSYEL